MAAPVFAIVMHYAHSESMLTSFSHPLVEVSAGRETLPPPMEDMTPADFPNDVLPSITRQAKLELGRFLYPWKNKIQRILSVCGGLPGPLSMNFIDKWVC